MKSAFKLIIVLILAQLHINACHGQCDESERESKFDLTIVAKNIDDDTPIGNCSIEIMRDDSVVIFGRTNDEGFYVYNSHESHFLETERNYEITIRIPFESREIFFRSHSKKITHAFAIPQINISNQFYYVFKTRTQEGCLLGLTTPKLTFGQEKNERDSLNTELDSAGKASLQNWILVLKQNPTWNIKLTYFASAIRPDKVVSQKRLDTVMELLKASKINMKRITSEIEYIGCYGNHYCVYSCYFKITSFNFLE